MLRSALLTDSRNDDDVTDACDGANSSDKRLWITQFMPGIVDKDDERLVSGLGREVGGYIGEDFILNPRRLRLLSDELHLNQCPKFRNAEVGPITLDAELRKRRLANYQINMRADHDPHHVLDITLVLGRLLEVLAALSDSAGARDQAVELLLWAWLH